MNISQVEQRTGLSRANIRYYEKEELISPARLENGYRDYSQDDVLELQRIKLLRQLEVPIAQISEIKQGNVSLVQVMRQCMANTRGSIRELECAEDVCRKICTEGVEYSELAPDRYMYMFHSGADGTRTSEIFRRDVVPYTPHPWRRYFARMLDMGLYGLVFFLLCHTAFGMLPATSVFYTLAYTVFSLACTAFVEPLLIARFKTTPGKWILGISVTDADGQKLSYSDAFDRTWNALWRGMGMDIPGYSQYRLVVSYNACTCRRMDWDEDVTYSVKKYSHWRTAVYAAVRIAVAALAAAAVIGSILPRHRGDLTPGEFADNYNRNMKLYQGMYDTNYTMAEDLTWSDNLNDVYEMQMSEGDSLWPDVRCTQLDGHLTSLTVDYRTKTGLYQAYYYAKIACMSFAGAQRGVGIVNGRYSAIEKAFDEHANYRDYSYELYGMEYTCKVEYEGLEFLDEYTPVPDAEAENVEIHVVYTVTKK